MAIRTVDLSEAETRLGELVSVARAGGEVIIEEDGAPVARIVPAGFPKKVRVADLQKDEIWTSDDFDAPLPDDVWVGGKP